jgi:hypothetical protein
MWSFACSSKSKLVTGRIFNRPAGGHIAANPGQPVILDVTGERVILQTLELHTIPTNGFTMTIENKTFGYAGDTQYEPTMCSNCWRRSN